MGSETEAKNDSAQTTNAAPAAAPPPKPNNPAAVKKAVALGKDIRKQSDKTKADAAREMCKREFFPAIAVRDQMC